MRKIYITDKRRLSRACTGSVDAGQSIEAVALLDSPCPIFSSYLSWYLHRRLKVFDHVGAFQFITFSPEVIPCPYSTDNSDFACGILFM